MPSGAGELQRSLVSDEDRACARRRKTREDRGWDKPLNSRNPYGTAFPPVLFIPGWPKCLGFALLLVVVGLCCTVWKAPLEIYGLSTFMLLKFLSLPLVSVGFTYAHIWAALWMTFYPLEFLGIPGTQLSEQPLGCGWQGIVPSKVKKMATISIETLLRDVISLDEIFGRIDPVALSRELDEPLAQMLANVVDKVGEQTAPKVWKSMPRNVKEELVQRMREESPQMMRDVLGEMRKNIDEVFDVKEMVVRLLEKDKPLLNHMFLSCGYNELEFIRDMGAYFGLFFGVIQMIQQYVWPAGWLLPVFGVAVGLMTNWMALKMIFEPVEPKSFCCGRIVLQGQFLKRQYEVAPQYGRIFANNLFSTRLLVPAILEGRKVDKFCELLHREVNDTIDRCVGALRPIVKMVGESSYAVAKGEAITRVKEALPDVFLAADGYLDKTLNLEELLTERVRAMKVGDFERLLHPVFEEDEWILILCGGFLGAVVGSLQWYVLGT